MAAAGSGTGLACDPAWGAASDGVPDDIAKSARDDPEGIGPGLLEQKYGRSMCGIC
jgi:hypothetical protein